MRQEQVYNDFSVDRSIQDLMRAEMSNADSTIKMWESGIVETLQENLSAVVEHEKTALRSFPPGYVHHDSSYEHDWPEYESFHQDAYIPFDIYNEDSHASAGAHHFDDHRFADMHHADTHVPTGIHHEIPHHFIPAAP
jgi:hypothetical protein